MKAFHFFLTRIFLRKPIFAIGTLTLLFLANYIVFSTARTVFSAREGYEQMARINAEGTFMASLDPDATVDVDSSSKESIQSVYDVLDDRYEYAFYTDGYITDLANSHGVEVPVGYMNQRYNELNGFSVAKGDGLTFDYSLDQGEAIPVLVGRGLADDYPLGSQFTMHDPALGRELTVRVVGIIAENSSHSILYAPDLKQYHNFSVVIPVLNNHSNISCTIRGRGYFGYLRWTGGDPQIAYVEDIPRHARFALGMSVVTSGYSSIFPPGLMVGKILHVFNSPNGLSYRLQIKLATDFGRLRDVCVVDNSGMEERLEMLRTVQDSLRVK